MTVPSHVDSLPPASRTREVGRGVREVAPDVVPGRSADPYSGRLEAVFRPSREGTDPAQRGRVGGQAIGGTQ